VRRAVVSWLDLWRTRPVAIRSTLPPAAAARRLAAARRGGLRTVVTSPPVAPRPVSGRISVDRVRLRAGRMGNRNSWDEVFRGRFVAGPDGCDLVGTVGWSPAVRVFTGLWLSVAGLIAAFGLVGFVLSLARGRPGAASALALAGVAAGMAALGMTLVGLAGAAGRRNGLFLHAWLARCLVDEPSPTPPVR
jgi:hypothetical protein